MVFNNDSYYRVTVTSYDEEFRPIESKYCVKCDYASRWLRQILKDSTTEILFSGVIYLNMSPKPKVINVQNKKL